MPEVLGNLTEFRSARWDRHHPVGLDIMLNPQLGIVFVAMKRNISDLPAVFRMANHLGALNFLVTNVLPYTVEAQDEILYSRALNDIKILAGVNYGEDSMGKDVPLPKELKYLRR